MKQTWEDHVEFILDGEGYLMSDSDMKEIFEENDVPSQVGCELTVIWFMNNT